MGVRLWTADPVPPELRPTAERRGLAGVFLTGVALNLGNPKMPLFTVALLPNVVGASLSLCQVGVLAGVILVVEVLVIGRHVAARPHPCEGGAAVREEAADGNGDGPEPVEPSRGGPVRESHKIYYGT
jgi:hypothetical protein